jgi:hypothetical protein
VHFPTLKYFRWLYVLLIEYNQNGRKIKELDESLALRLETQAVDPAKPTQLPPTREPPGHPRDGTTDQDQINRAQAINSQEDDGGSHGPVQTQTGGTFHLIIALKT